MTVQTVNTKRVMPAKDVKAYVKRNKNDAADAEAICEAARRPTVRFVQIKSTEQQGRLMLHRARDLLMRQRTQLINALRAHLAELGIVAAQGSAGLKELLKIIAGERDARLPVDAHASLVVLAAGLHAVKTMIGSIDKRIMIEHRSNTASKRLRSIPGIGIVGASAIVADPMAFRPRCSCWRPSVRAPKVRSCFEFASDLRDVAALKARARKFVLRRHTAAVRFSDRRCAVRRTAANLIHGALPLK